MLNMVLPKDTTNGQKEQFPKILKANLNISYPYWRYLCFDYKNIQFW